MILFVPSLLACGRPGQVETTPGRAPVAASATPSAAPPATAAAEPGRAQPAAGAPTAARSPQAAPAAGAVPTPTSPAATATTAPARPTPPAPTATPLPSAPTSPPRTPTPAPPSATRPPAATTTPASLVRSVRTLVEPGGRVDWSPKGDLILYDWAESGRSFEIYVMQPDGSGKRCLTCGRPGAPTRHKGNPGWHPSGAWVVFQAEKAVHRGGSIKATPGRGIDNDLWLMSSDGSRYYQLNSVAAEMGVLHPRFSADGRRLVWSERVAVQGGSSSGSWAIKVADFAVDERGARLSNVQTLQPHGPAFYETFGFSPDGRSVLYAANGEPGQDMAGMDIYWLDLATGTTRRLTNTLAGWDEHAQLSPDGKRVLWMSSEGCDCTPGKVGDLRTDYWVMNADGSGKTRLTYFNRRGYLESSGVKTVAADSSWSPDGTRFVAYLIESSSMLEFLEGAVGRIVLVELARLP